jgi:DNA-binding NarL/FixJ family response regulator
MLVGVVAGYVVARRVLARRAPSVAALADRQREVLRAVAGGLSTKEISELPGSARPA